MTKKIKMEEKEMTSSLKKFYDCLVSCFLEEAKQRDEDDWQPKQEGRVYYHKWSSTLKVASKLKVTAKVVRDNLTKLEKLGFVEAKRECNHIRWAAKNIEGFEQMIFSDYYWRTLTP